MEHIIMVTGIVFLLIAGFMLVLGLAIAKSSKSRDNFFLRYKTGKNNPQQ